MTHGKTPIKNKNSVGLQSTDKQFSAYNAMLYIVEHSFLTETIP